MRLLGKVNLEFVPVNVYQTADSWLYIAIGNDVQWRRLTELAPFRSLAREKRETNEGRRQDRRAIHDELATAVRAHGTADLLPLLQGAGVVAYPVHSIGDVRDLPGIREHLNVTRLPDGREVRLPPSAVETERREYSLSPQYGEHTRTVLEQTGLTGDEIDGLMSDLGMAEDAAIAAFLRVTSAMEASDMLDPMPRDGDPEGGADQLFEP